MGEYSSCIRGLAEECRSANLHPVVCNSLEAAAASSDTFCTYARLRLALEAMVQHAYYKLLGVSEEEAERRIRVRSKYYASFTVNMIRRLRGVHGARRRWLIKVYLRLGEWLHPTARLRKAAGSPPADPLLLMEVLDAIGYLALITGGNMPSWQLAERCGLEKSLRLLARRGEGLVEG